MTITYDEMSSRYAKQAGVTIKTITKDHEPEHPSTMYAIGQDIEEYFECSVDSFGNICDADGIVVFPSGSGANPLERGERGYFGEFLENYAMDRSDASVQAADLPSCKKAISVRSARKAANLTQQALADASGVNIRQLQKLESGEIKIANMTFGSVSKIAKAIGVDMRDLI